MAKTCPECGFDAGDPCTECNRRPLDSDLRALLRSLVGITGKPRKRRKRKDERGAYLWYYERWDAYWNDA